MLENEYQLWIEWHFEKLVAWHRVQLEFAIARTLQDPPKINHIPTVYCGP